MELLNHVGIFDNAYSQQECDALIQHFHDCQNMGLTYTRKQLQEGEGLIRKDNTAFMLTFEQRVHHAQAPIKNFLDKFWPLYAQYMDVYDALELAQPQTLHSMRLQKTEPGEGYHVWHFESATRRTQHCITTFTLYLNDVEDGGETEFLYTPMRVEAKMGRLAVMPSGYTHTHRGNPPLNKTKYILTGWLEL